MEIHDLLYLEMMRELGSDANVMCIYDLRTVDDSKYPAVILYYLRENDRWLNVGGGDYIKEEYVAVEVIDNDKRRFMNVRDGVFKMLNGKSIVQKGDEGYIDVSDDVVSVESVSFSIDKVTVSDVSGVNIGDRIYYGDYGWVRYIDGYDLYVFKPEGEFVLVGVKNVVDSSDKLKMLYRCLFTISGYMIEVV